MAKGGLFCRARLEGAAKKVPGIKNHLWKSMKTAAVNYNGFGQKNLIFMKTCDAIDIFQKNSNFMQCVLSKSCFIFSQNRCNL